MGAGRSQGWRRASWQRSSASVGSGRYARGWHAHRQVHRGAPYAREADKWAESHRKMGSSRGPGRCGGKRGLAENAVLHSAIAEIGWLKNVTETRKWVRFVIFVFAQALLGRRRTIPGAGVERNDRGGSRAPPYNLMGACPREETERSERRRKAAGGGTRIGGGCCSLAVSSGIDGGMIVSTLDSAGAGRSQERRRESGHYAAEVLPRKRRD